jgi:hypothetical protein
MDEWELITGPDKIGVSRWAPSYWHQGHRRLSASGALKRSHIQVATEHDVGFSICIDGRSETSLNICTVALKRAAIVLFRQ